MSRFITPLDMRLMCDANWMPLRNRDGRQLYQLLAPFVYLSDVAGLITVPAGFITDLASIPRMAMSLFGEVAQEPGVVHDYAYSVGCVSRAVADNMLYEACLLTGESVFTAKLIYAGVRLGGASHYTDADLNNQVRATCSAP